MFMTCFDQAQNDRPREDVLEYDCRWSNDDFLLNTLPLYSKWRSWQSRDSCITEKNF